MLLTSYIDEQPKLLYSAIEKRKEITGALVKSYLKLDADIIYIIGSGSSRNAALTSSLLMEEVLEIPVIVSSSSKEIVFKGQRPIVFYISQGGYSTNTIAAIENNSRKEAFTVSVTGNSDSVITRLCNETIEIPCGPEKAGPKTKGYTLTVALLYLFAIEASKFKTEKYIKALFESAEKMEGNIKRTREWTEKNYERFTSLKSCAVVGKGVGEHIAQEGALKLMETLLFPAYGMEAEEYMHGPACAISKDVGGFYLMPPSFDIDRDRVSCLASYHQKCSKSAFLIGGDERDDERNLTLETSGKWYTAPFEQILPFQIISDVVPDKSGIEGEGTKKFWEMDEFLKIKQKRT